MESNNSTNGTTVNPNSELLHNISLSLNQAMAAITDVQSDLEKPQTFLYDTLSNFFDYVEEHDNKDIETLLYMWYSIQHYKVYVETALEYILNIPRKLGQIHHNLQTEFDSLTGGVSA